MKSIPAALLTDIDLDIWECLMNRWGAGLRPKAHESDQRDADLMQTAQQHKGCVAHWASWRRHSVLLRGLEMSWVAPLTEEGYDIWLRWSEVDNGAWFRFYRDSDRRDADLMSRAMWSCPACGRQTRRTFAYQVDWLWRRCRCGNIWAIEPRYWDTT